MPTPDAIRPGADSAAEIPDVRDGSPDASTGPLGASGDAVAAADPDADADANDPDDPPDDAARAGADETAAVAGDDEDAAAPRRRVPGALRRVHRWILRLLALLCTLAFAVLAAGPHLFDYRTVTMRSGSMRPFAGPGDMLVVRPEPLAAVRPGQVLTIEAPVPGHPVLSHRVVHVERRAGTVTIRTKGDANSAPDSWVAQLGGATAWRTVLVVPHVGRLMAVLHRPAVHAVSSWLLPVWLLAEVLHLLWRRPTGHVAVTPEDQTPDETPDERRLDDLRPRVVEGDPA